MSRWAGAFLGIAIVAAILDFGNFTGAAPGTARTLFALFLVVFSIRLVRVSLPYRGSSAGR